MTDPADDEVLEAGTSRTPVRWLWPAVLALLVVAGVIGFVLHGDGTAGRAHRAGTTPPVTVIPPPPIPIVSVSPVRLGRTDTACPAHASCRPTATSGRVRSQVLAAIRADFGRVDSLRVTTVGEQPRDRSCGFHDRVIAARLPLGGSVRVELSDFDPSVRLVHTPVQGQHRVFVDNSAVGRCYVYGFATVASDATVIGHHMSNTDAEIAHLSSDARLATP